MRKILIVALLVTGCAHRAEADLQQMVYITSEADYQCQRKLSHKEIKAGSEFESCKIDIISAQSRNMAGPMKQAALESYRRRSEIFSDYESGKITQSQRDELLLSASNATILKIQASLDEERRTNEALQNFADHVGRSDTQIQSLDCTTMGLPGMMQTTHCQ